MEFIFEDQLGVSTRFYSNNILVYADGTNGTYEGKFVKGKPEGLFKLYYVSGKLHTEGAYKNGKEEGMWKDFREDGTLIQEGNYKNGIKEGVVRLYHESGKIWMESILKNGIERDGMTKIYKDK